MGDKMNRASGWTRRITGELYERWPKDANGEPEPPVYLTHRSGLDMDDTALMGMLEAYGIPCLRRYPGDGEFGKLILGMSGSGVDLFVPATRWADACGLLEGADYDGAEGTDDGPENHGEL